MSSARKRLMRVYWRNYARAAAVIVIAVGTAAIAQQGGFLGRNAVQPKPFRSFTHIQTAPPREFRKNDLITLDIDYRSTALSEGDMQRRRQASITALLPEWLRFRGLDLKPAPQADGDLGISASTNQQMRNSSDSETTEAMRFSIAARIEEVRPNGLLVVAGKRTIKNNGDTWTQIVTGIIRPDDILPNNTVRSEDIYNLYIDKQEQGEVASGYRPGFVTKMLDFLNPF